MKSNRHLKVTGFVLIEALIALLIVSIGLIAIAKLETLAISAAGESRSRAEAMAYAQALIERLRNNVLESGFTGLTSGECHFDGSDSAPCPAPLSGQTNSTYIMKWTFPPSCTTAAPCTISINTRWTDRFNVVQVLTLNSLIAWDAPFSQTALQAGNSGANPIAPTGTAKRGTTQYEGGPPEGATNNNDGTYTHERADHTVELIDASGRVIVFLDPINGVAQQFTTIEGRVYFDRTVNQNQLPTAAQVQVRLSSEGECFYDTSALTQVSSGGSTKYEYFAYRCYVGSAWYGNVGILNLNLNRDPNFCVGDPGFTYNSTSTSAHAYESGIRVFRGFRAQSNYYLSTGVTGGSQYPPNGAPRPAAFPSIYGSIDANSPNNRFLHNFLITKLTGNNASCAHQLNLVSGEFTRNAGKNYCITPDNYPDDADVCPTVWPGFESEIGTGGTVNYTLTVNVNGSGTVSGDCVVSQCSVPNGTQVTLYANPAQGASFGSWQGCTSTNANQCTVTVTSNTAVTATFTNGGGSLQTLTVAKSGAGSGTVSGDGINCGATCSVSSYTLNQVVTLTAAADSGSTFAGWTGCDTTNGSNQCVVTMSASKSVSAAFSVSAQPCNTPISGSRFSAAGNVSSNPAGNCNQQGGQTPNYSCGVTAVPGTVITLTETKSGNGGYTKILQVTADCAAHTNVNFQ